MEKDSKRFPKSGGWGYALFNYEAASDKFTADPQPLGLRTHVPCGREGEGLHLPPVPEALNRGEGGFRWSAPEPTTLALLGMRPRWTRVLAPAQAYVIAGATQTEPPTLRGFCFDSAAGSGYVPQGQCVFPARLPMQLEHSAHTVAVRYRSDPRPAKPTQSATSA